MKSVALCFCVVVTLGLCLVTGGPGNAQSFTSDVLDNQSVTLTDRNLIFLGHSTAFWDSSRKTERSARQLIQLGQQYGITRVATVARHMMKDPGLAGLHYFNQSDVNLVLESRAGNHRLVLPNLKNIFFVGGNLNRCLCEGIRDAAIGFAEAPGFESVNIYLVTDGIYASHPPFSPVKDPQVASEFVERFFVPAFNCPLQNWGRAVDKRIEMPGVALKLFFQGEWLKTFDLEPGDTIPVEQLKKTINVHFITSDKVEMYLRDLPK